MNRWLIFCLIFVVWSCDFATREKQKVVDEYYDINGLIDEQIELLDSINPSLFKVAMIDGQEEKLDFVPGDSLWKKELLIFRSLDINKPMLVDRYDIKKNTDGDQPSVSYISKSPKATMVDSLIVYLNSTGEPLGIHALLKGENALFKTSKKLEMRYTTKGEHQLLSDFSIKGWQKMISKDSTTYHIEATVRYN